jgi:hypothetical protein
MTTVESGDQTYLPGMVVVQRRWKPVVGKKRGRARVGWTLHRETCGYVGRSSTAMPAPARAYPDTVPCSTCRPDGSHEFTWTELPDGRVAVACSCGGKGEGDSREIAVGKVYKFHGALKAAEAARRAQEAG